MVRKKKKRHEVDGGKPHERMDKMARGGSHRIQGAVPKSHKGIFTAKADKAGKSVHEMAEEHKHDSGKLGNEARLALTFQKMAKK